MHISLFARSAVGTKSVVSPYLYRETYTGKSAIMPTGPVNGCDGKRGPAEAVAMSIFKACDIRGVYGSEVTGDVFYRIGRSLGTILGRKSVIVGGDVRVSTPVLRSALIRGLVDSGVAVLDIGIVPTPAFYFAKQHLNADAGAMITASHNPPEFNGLKLILGSLPITEDELREVQTVAELQSFSSGEGSLQEIGIIPAYRSFIESIAPKRANAEPCKVVVDCGNGCYSGLAPAVFRSFGYRTEELFCIPDGTFPNRSPNSAEPKSLAALCRKVRDTGASLGVAFDGDGDRVAYVDDRGQFLSSDKAIVILCRHVLQTCPGDKVVYDIKCSSVVPQSIVAAGGVPLAERSGHTFIKTRMITEDAAFGGELSGHYFYRELQGGDDGLYSALLMASIVSQCDRSLSELAEEIPERVVTPDIRVQYSGDGSRIIEGIASAFPDSRVSRLDGVKVTFPQGWGLARLSVTEPVITLRFEAESSDVLAEIMDAFLEPVPEIREAVLRRVGTSEHQ